ncbi:MAG: dynamin family protein [Burkholderiaceae bacterium]|jgi:hypothetical protein
MNNLVEKFQEYSTWRFTLTRAIERYREWLKQASLGDAQTDARINRVLGRLADDKLSIAFVAEFSRGKSELINSIFFADYGQRILPSSAGRTTMCPTELLYDDTLPASIRLLPIETRAFHATTAEYKALPQEWQVFPLDTSSGDGMLQAFRQVSLVKRVSVDDARRYGLFDETDPDQMNAIDGAGTVEVSMWRHAVINFPHPLLEQGLVILDTPGLNAIGTEPELTLNLIPNAHAVLFILAADTGVTKSDIEVWRKHIGGPRKQGRMVVLNKIDSMWDELKTPAEVDAEIQKQVDSCAQILGLETHQMFPVSAQKGLLAKVNHDDALLAKSRLPALEQALSVELIPQKQSIVRELIRQELIELVQGAQGILTARETSLGLQAAELRSLRGKNSSVVTHMVARVRAEKDEFDKTLVTFQAMRSVYSKLTHQVFADLGLNKLRDDVRSTRERMMQELTFSTALRAAMQAFFMSARRRLGGSQEKIDEISRMVASMYQRFGTEHGMILGVPMGFSLSRYRGEIERVEKVYQERFGLLTILSTDQLVLTQKFFESIASRVKETFETANRDVEAWLKAIIAPLEGQIREHQSQLRRRLESIRHIQDASETLEERIGEVNAQQSELEGYHAHLHELNQEMMATLESSVSSEESVLTL